MVPTVSDPKTWVPYMNTRDCSQGFCSLYCPQWCYIIFPPPPPFDFPEDNNSGPSFSPLVIAIIGILASAFLLVSYYAIMSKYCGNRRGRIRESDDNNQRDSDDSEENQDPSIHGQPWNSANTGLDEALIKSITVFKYKKGDGVVIDGSDCPVCLSEFQEDENLRLLPKCSHSFHVNCIDTWLKSHSNCPLCRSNIVFLNPSLPPPIMDPPSTAPEPQNQEQSSAEQEETEAEEAEESAETNNPPKSPERNHHTITIREDNLTRRSVSMDSSPCQARLSIADILRIDHDEECSFHDSQMQEIGSSKAEIRQSVLGCVISPAVMHRSFSSGRFFFPKLNRPPTNTSILPS
ncbi:E3 ubiquitin-protein ligase Os04g0590900-like [Ipomoea triloba]|uniref:E3 ubiquitin-protein ligase Os04g0590900-like n=1 Tax=Ipomoea triloba TaxID=35885 RepID=UPI00125E5290|nr:E3 ubiquitin-protein ligase Os04g0590900-like [Ipomoea triloba]